VKNHLLKILLMRSLKIEDLVVEIFVEDVEDPICEIFVGGLFMTHVLMRVLLLKILRGLFLMRAYLITIHMLV